MAYIGNIPAEKFTSVDIQNFTVSATANYTLDRPVANENEIELFINNVRQHPGSGKAYTASGTALTLSEATAGTDTMYCVYQGKARQTVTPATSSVTNAMLAGSIDLTSKVTGALPQANIADQAINEAKLQISNAPTNGYMLTAQSGNTGGLTWAEASSGNHVLLGSSASGSGTSSVSFNNVFSSTYDQYLILAHRLTTNDNDENVYVRMRASSSDFTSSNYNYIITGNKSNTTGTSNINFGYTNQPQWMFTRGIENTDAQAGGALSFHLFDPYDATFYTRAQGVSSIRKASTGDLEAHTIGGQVDSTTQFDGISIYPSGGTFAQHEIYIYGIKES